MTVGKAAATANSYLNIYRGTTYTGVTAYMKLHIGDPGAMGTANPSAVTTRNAVTFAAPSAGSMGLSSISPYSMTTSETVSHVSFHDANSGGTFLESAALTSNVPVINGSTLNFSVITLAFVPLAA